MAKSFTTHSLVTPVVTLSLVAGGTLLPNTTYHFRVMAHSDDRYTDTTYHQSPPSSVVSITTDTTNLSVKVSIAQVVGAHGYTIWRSKDITGTNPWNDLSKTSVLKSTWGFVPTVVVDSGLPVTDFIDDGTFGYNQHSWRWIYCLEFGLPRGDFNSTLGDIITMEDLQANFSWVTRPNTHRNYPKQYNVAGCLRITGAQTIWNIKNEDIVFWGNIFSQFSGTTFNVNELKGTTYKSSEYASKLTFRWYPNQQWNANWGPSTVNVHHAIINVDSLNIVGLVQKFSIWSQILLGGQANTDLRDLLLEGHQDFQFQATSPNTITLRNIRCVSTRFGVSFAGTGTFDVEDITIEGVGAGLFIKNTGLVEQVIKGLRLSRWDANTPDNLVFKNGRVLLLDPVFPNGVDQDFSDNRFEWAGNPFATEWTSEQLKLNFNFNTQVLSEKGDPVSGVTLDIVDGQGNLYPQLSTDINGKVSVPNGLNLTKYVPNDNFHHVFTYDKGTATFTDVSHTNTFALFPNDAAVNDAIYFAQDNLWGGINLYIGTAFAATSQTFILEYFDGTNWVSPPSNRFKWQHTTTNPPTSGWAAGQTNFVVGYHNIEWGLMWQGMVGLFPQPVQVNGITSRFVRMRITAVTASTNGGDSAPFPTVYSYVNPYAGNSEIGMWGSTVIGVKTDNNPFVAVFRKLGFETHRMKFNLAETLNTVVRLRHSPTPGRDEMGDSVR